MRGLLFGLVTAAMLGFAAPGLALESGTDCAEGADEDLATTQSETAQPLAANEKPLS